MSETRSPVSTHGPPEPHAGGYAKMAGMLVGSFSDVDDIVKTTPWGTEHAVTFYEYMLDGEPGWSLFLMVNPLAGDDAEGLVYAVGPGRERAAVIGLAPKRRVYEINDLLRDAAANRDLRDLARLLQRLQDGIL
jgi:hypothetical protein